LPAQQGTGEQKGCGLSGYFQKLSALDHCWHSPGFDALSARVDRDL
jgi:hypothetical protein